MPGSGRTVAIVSIVVVLLCRFWLALDVPLTDTTEARYGEMARKMVETGDWLMPQHDYEVPYLAKPPLAVWFAATGIELLGPGEIGPRALIMLSAIAFLFYLYHFMRTTIGSRTAMVTVLMLSGSILFFVAAGAVMTDLLLVACVNTGLMAFWQHMRGVGKQYEWIFFVGAGLGLLAKGPLALVLMGAPILFWLTAFGRVREAWRNIAWFRGALLAAIIAIPWYLAAEHSHSGFLRYFLIGEHVQRFLVSDWQGDLYGQVHELPHGAVWLFLLIGALPWSILAPGLFWRARGGLAAGWRRHRELIAFFLIAALAPLFLFTAAQNVIAPYALPALVPGVIAATALLGEESVSHGVLRFVSVASAATAVTLVVTALALHGRIEQESDREMIVAAQAGAPVDTVYYWQRRYYSAEYYSEGHAPVVADPAVLRALIDSEPDFRVVMQEGQFAALPASIQGALHRIGDYSKKALYAPGGEDSPDTRAASRH